MPDVNPEYQYTETDIEQMLPVILGRHGFKLAPNGTVFSKDGSLYTVDGHTITIATPQVLGSSMLEESIKLKKLDASLKEPLELAKSILIHVVLFPLLVGKHWVLVAASFKAHQVLEVGTFDSMRGIVPIAAIRKMLNPIFKKHIKSEWTLLQFLETAYDYGFSYYGCPKQPDSSSCGALVVKNIEDLVRKGSVDTTLEITPEKVVEIRQWQMDMFADPVFSERQYYNIPDTILRSKHESPVEDSANFACFYAYISTLPHERQQEFFIIAQQFVSAETNLERVNDAKKSLDKKIHVDDPELQAASISASAMIIAWIHSHKIGLAALVSKFFKITALGEYRWQEQQPGIKDGKDALLAVLSRCLEERPRSRSSSPRPEFLLA